MFDDFKKRSVAVFLTVWIFGVLLSIAFWTAVIVIGIHFSQKYW